MSRRDEWMLSPSGDNHSITDPLSSITDRATPSRISNKDGTGKPVRELNPYFKDGGTGLPPEAPSTSPSSSASLLGFLKPQSISRIAPHSRDEPEKVKHDLNQLSARKLKAELAGDTKLVSELEEIIRSSRANDKRPTERPPSMPSVGSFKGDNHIGERHAGGGKRGWKRHKGENADCSVDGEQMLAEERKRMALSNLARADKIQQQCPFCLDSDRADHKLLIAMGNFCYLAVPKEGLLDPLHVLIVPMQHAASSLHCDENVWEEVRNFKKSLLQMAASLGREAIFLETVMRPQEPSHTAINCVILPKGLSVDPRAYFRKALLECDSEWTQHRRLIETGGERGGGLRKAIPKNFPFVYVDFRLDQGYAHIIEDVHLVDAHFLLGLTAELIGLRRHEWKGRPLEEETITLLRRHYQPFDWTELLRHPED